MVRFTVLWPYSVYVFNTLLGFTVRFKSQLKSIFDFNTFFHDSIYVTHTKHAQFHIHEKKTKLPINNCYKYTNWCVYYSKPGTHLTGRPFIFSITFLLISGRLPVKNVLSLSVNMLFFFCSVQNNKIQY